jgi:hypothetical protein
MKKILAWVVALALVLAALAPLDQTRAQGPDPLPLTKTYTTADGLSFNYPEGWSVVEVKEGDYTIVTLHSSADLEARGFESALNPGEIQVMLVTGEAAQLFADLGASAGATPLQALQATAVSSSYQFGTPYETTLAGMTVAQVEGTNSDGSFDFVAIIAQVGDTAILLQGNLAPGERDQFAPTILALAESVLSSSGGGPATAAAASQPPAAELRQWATNAFASSQYSNPDWSALQATGAPDTDLCGDIVSAWASATATGQDWLRLEYAVPVVPTEVNIRQTYNPGSIVRVDVISADGKTFTLPDSADPPGHTSCPGVFTVPVPPGLPAVNVVVIYLDQSIGGDWNEIDAVELVGEASGEVVVEPTGPAAETPSTGSGAPLPARVTCDIGIDLTVNMRSGPGTDFIPAGQLSPGTTVRANGQAAGTDGYTWWRLTSGAWVREDVVSPTDACATLPLTDPEEPLPLTERYVTAEGYTFDYPQDWVVVQDGSEYILGNSDAAANKPFGDPFEPGEFQITLKWGTVDEIVPVGGLTATATAMEVMEAAIANASGIDLNAPYELAIGDYVVAAAYGTFMDMDVELGVVIFEAGGGIFGTVLTISDTNGLEQFEPTVRAIVGSALVAGPPAEPQAETGAGTPPGEAPAPAADQASFDLTQTLTFEAEKWTLSIPGSWIAEDKGGYILIKSDEWVAAILGLNPGQVEISIDIGLSTDPSALVHVITFAMPMADSQGFTLSDPVELTLGGKRAARVDATVAGKYHLVAFAIERDDGQYTEVFAYTHPDEFALYEPVILAILDSLVELP